MALSLTQSLGEVRHAWRSDGSGIKRWRERPLKELKSALSKHKSVDLDVYWKGKEALQTRIVATWNEQEKRPRYLVTNLPREAFSVEQVCDAYRLRCANLHASIHKRQRSPRD